MTNDEAMETIVFARELLEEHGFGTEDFGIGRLRALVAAGEALSKRPESKRPESKLAGPYVDGIRDMASRGFPVPAHLVLELLEDYDAMRGG